MPFLQEDGTIAFESIQEFVDEYASNISNNGLMAKTDADWPLRKARSFFLHIASTEERFEITAEVVAVMGDQVGLQISADPITQRDLKRLLERLQDRLPVKAPEEEEAPSDHGLPPVDDMPPPVSEAAPPPLQDPPAPVVDEAPPPQDPPVPVVEAAAPAGDNFTVPERARIPSGEIPPQAGDDFTVPERARIPSGEIPPPVDEIPPPTGKRKPTGPQQASAEEAQEEPQEEPPDDDPVEPMRDLTITGSVVSRGDLKDLLDIEQLEFTKKNMKDISLLSLIASLSKTDLPMLLTVSPSGKRYQFYFNNKGHIVQFNSIKYVDDLLTRLANKGKFNMGNKQQVLDLIAAGRPVEHVLIGQGMTHQRDYWIALRSLVIDALVDIRSNGKVPFQLRAAAIERDMGLPFGALAFSWLEEAIRRVPIEELDEYFEPQWFRYVSMNRHAPWPLHTLALNKRLFRFIQKTVNGSKMMSHLRKDSPLGQRATKRTLFIMSTLGLFALSNQPVLIGEGEDPEVLLKEEIAILKDKSKFEQLGVHWSSHPFSYNGALEKIKAEYGRDGKWIRFHPETQPLCDEIIEIAQEAKRFLESTSRRKNYRSKFISGFQLIAAADLLFRQAELALFRKEITKAKRNLQVAMEIYPRPEYLKLLDKL